MQTVPRLIDQFVPKNYNLSLTLDRVERKFGGIVTIRGAVRTYTKSIILHSKDLVIESVVFDGKSAKFSFGDNDELIITHPDIDKGDHIIVVAFGGKITDSMHGLYPCYYDHDGAKKELLATQFESHHAREVFPCIDEPAAKATFDVTLTTEPDVIVLGNMPIRIQKNENNRLVTTFDTTPVMSSYLLAWVVGELHKKTAQTRGGVEVNVWATPAQSTESLDFALDIAARSIDFFDEYFGVAYPLPKSDHVALPDFASGAMENWGLITYREVALLADPASTSIASKRYAATVIAHELSHQWFGNLVTMEWWNDLWLNESFASLVEYIAIDSLEPSWNVWLDFASHESIAALRRDSLDGVQSVQTDINHPDEIGTLFDGAIVYAKGARLLQMLRYYIGDEAFQAGLKKYFKTHAYKNTTANDLWSAFKDVSEKDIETLMNCWIRQPGFPVIHVCRQDNQILLSQNRLSNKLIDSSDALWPTPLNSNHPDIPELFDTKSLTIDWSDTCYLHFNVGSNAHFITHYSDNLLDQMMTCLKNGDLSPIDRLQLLNEQVILASAGIISSAKLVPLLGSFTDETIGSVWNIICLTIGELKKFIETDVNAESKLHSFAKSLAKKQYKRLGWTPKTNEPETDTKLRGTILGLMLYSEDSNVISTAKKIFHSTSIEKLDPELRSIIFSAVVQHDGDDTLDSRKIPAAPDPLSPSRNHFSAVDDTTVSPPSDKMSPELALVEPGSGEVSRESSTVVKSLIQTYENTDSAELQQDICSGLTATRDPKIVTKLLNMVQNTSVVRTQDTFRWIIYLIRNKYSRTQTWQWIRDNWSWINQTFSGDKSYDDYPRYVATALSNTEQLKEYCDFFTPLQSDPALTRVISIGINEIKNRIDTIERDGSSVREILLNL